jgi:hypothetical protein
LCEIVVAVVVVVAMARLLDESWDDVQQMDIILKAMNINAMRIVDTMPIKYGVESCALATIKLSAMV